MWCNVVDFVGVKQDLQDGLNYGLFCPPDNGRAGKFMDEERLLTDYALPVPIGYLEVTSWYDLEADTCIVSMIIILFQSFRPSPYRLL